MDCSLPASSVHGIFQARILKWVAISFSRRSSRPRDQTHISCIAGRFFATEPPGKHTTWKIFVQLTNYIAGPKNTLLEYLAFIVSNPRYLKLWILGLLWWEIDPLVNKFYADYCPSRTVSQCSATETSCGLKHLSKVISSTDVLRVYIQTSKQYSQDG